MKNNFKYIAFVLVLIITFTVKYETYSFFATRLSGVTTDTLTTVNYFLTGIVFFISFVFFAKKVTNSGVKTVLAAAHSVIYITFMLFENSFYRFIYINGFLTDKKMPYLDFLSEQAVEFFRIGKPCYLLIMLIFAAVCFIYILWNEDGAKEKRRSLMEEIFIMDDDELDDLDDIFDDEEPEYSSVEEAFAAEHENSIFKLRHYCYSLDVTEENKLSLIKCLDRYGYDFIYRILLTDYIGIITAQEFDKLKAGYFDILDRELEMHKNENEGLKAELEGRFANSRAQEMDYDEE